LFCTPEAEVIDFSNPQIPPSHCHETIDNIPADQGTLIDPSVTGFSHLCSVLNPVQSLCTVVLFRCRKKETERFCVLTAVTPINVITFLGPETAQATESPFTLD
jgi:hypothetical protein